MGTNKTDKEKEMEENFKKLGLIQTPDEDFSLTSDAALIKQNLKLYFGNGDEGTKRTEAFISTFASYIENPVLFKKCLYPVLFNKSEEQNRSFSNNESLIKIFLSIPELQTEIFELLLERLAEIVNSGENVNLTQAKTILNQFRWLDQLSEPRHLLELLISQVEISPPIIQHEIIQILPEIFIDIDQTDLLEKLTDLASKSTNLFVPIIECLGALSIPTTDLDYTIELVSNRLDTLDLESLAVAVQFLLNSSKDEHLLAMLQNIRIKIDLDHIQKIQKKKELSELTRKRKGVNTDEIEKTPSCLLLVDTINSTILINNQLKNTWLKLIENLTSNETIYALDILVMSMMHSIPTMRKKVKEVFKSKVSSGLISPRIVNNTIQMHLKLVQKNTIEFLSLAEYLTREAKTQPKLGEAANALYSTIFLNSDVFFQQEAVGSIVTHIGSGNTWEIDHALTTLDKIVYEDSAGLMKFLIFIKGILDYLDRLSLDQINKLFKLYALLSMEETNRQNESAFFSELNMVVRKQLTHPSEKYKVVGITACISMVKQLSKMYENSLEDNNLHASAIPGPSNQAYNPQNHPIYLRAKSILELIQKVCPSHSSSFSLICNQLADVITSNELHIDLVKWIFDAFASGFTDLFILEKEDNKNKLALMPSWPSSFKFSYWDNLGDDDGDVAIKILPTVISYYYNTRESYHPDLICSLFKLYQACERTIEGNLDAIGALLLCEIVMFDKECIDDVKNSGEAGLIDCLAISLVIASNWYRELINAFCTFSDKFILAKIKQRLIDLASLEEFMQYFTINKHHMSYTGYLPILEAPGSAKQASLHDIQPLEIRQYLHPLDPKITKLILPESNQESKNKNSSMQLGKEESLYILDNFRITIQATFCSTGLNVFKKYAVKDSEVPKLAIELCDYIKSLGMDNGVESSSADFEEPSLALDCLQILIEKSGQFNKKKVTSTAENDYKTIDIFNKLSGLSELTMDFKISIKLHKLLSSLYKTLSDMPKYNEFLALFTKGIVSKPWGGKPSREKKNELIYLLKEELYFSKDKFEVVAYYLNNLLIPSARDEESVSSNFPNYLGSMMPIYYKILSSQLIEISASVNLEESLEDEGILSWIRSLLDMWHEFVRIATTTSDNALLLIALQHGRQFVDNFIKTLLPFLDYYLPIHRQRVLVLLKHTQASTRKLQNICNVTKTKGKALASAVPTCRASLETLVLEVKMLCKNHNILDAFTIGDLKPRAIDGNPISSQFPAEEILSEKESTGEEPEIASLPSKAKKRNRTAFGGRTKSKVVKKEIQEEDMEEFNENNHNIELFSDGE